MIEWNKMEDLEPPGHSSPNKFYYHVLSALPDIDGMTEVWNEENRII